MATYLVTVNNVLNQLPQLPNTPITRHQLND